MTATWKYIAAGIAVLALALGIVSSVLLTLKQVDSMSERAAQRATEATDAKWKAEIERTNAEAEKKVADQAKASLEIEADANARINQVSQDYEELRKRSEALPDGTAVGLSRERGKLLTK